MYLLRISKSLSAPKRYGNAGFNPVQTHIVFCFFLGNSIVVLTHGLVKRSQKTPKQEIEKAETYRKDFLKRRMKP